LPRATKFYTPLLLGYVTEVTPLTYPEGSSSDELNSYVTNKKSRVPRLGFQKEIDYTESSVGTVTVTSNHYWENPDNLKRTRFLVVQINSVLHFWDVSTYNCSGNKKSFTVDLDNYLNPFSSTADNDVVDVASGKGFLFVASPSIEPLYITYDSVTDTVSVTEVTLKIRDFKLLNTTEEFTDQPVNPSIEFKYNLLNQGWSDYYIDQYINGTDISGFSGYNHYPSLTKHWALGKKPYVSSQSSPDAEERRKIGLSLFDPRELEAAYTGTTIAPNGHFIYDAFRIERTVDGTPVSQEIKNKRPISVAFKFGRAWWTDGDLIYFSQIIEQDVNKAALCYQDADPTSEDISDLIDTDGGTINILEAGFVLKVMAASNSVIVFTENGVWDISGQEGESFKPTAYIPRKISDSELVSIKAVTDIEGVPLWAATDGLYTLTLDQVSRSYSEQSLTDLSIKTYYDAITNKGTMDIDFDRASKKVYFQHGLNVLVYDLINGSFHPWTVSTSGSKSIIGTFSTKDRGTITEELDIVANDQLVESDGEQVIISVPVTSDNLTTIKFIILDGSNLTFGSFIDTEHYDWENVEYSTYIETGYLFEEAPVNRKSIPYITFWFRENSIDSECLFRHKWDFTNSTESKLWTDAIDIYETRGIYRDVTSTTRQLHGSGNFVVLRWEGVPGKSFELYGYYIEWDVDPQRKDRM
jgi:hypothetical protein